MFVGLNVHNHDGGLNSYQAQCEQMGVYLLRDAMPKPGLPAWQRILDAMAAGYAFDLWCADIDVAGCAANINAMPVSTGPGVGGIRMIEGPNEPSRAASLFSYNGQTGYPAAKAYYNDLYTAVMGSQGSLINNWLCSSDPPLSPAPGCAIWPYSNVGNTHIYPAPVPPTTITQVINDNWSDDMVKYPNLNNPPWYPITISEYGFVMDGQQTAATAGTHLQEGLTAAQAAGFAGVFVYSLHDAHFMIYNGTTQLPAGQVVQQWIAANGNNY